MSSNHPSPQVLMAIDAYYWASRAGILLDGKPFGIKGHEYQIEPMQDDSRRQVDKKAAQLGWTSIRMLGCMHGLITGKYPQGVLYLFPTRDDVADFSRGRFAPLIEDNPSIASEISSTDAANIKRVGSSMLYLRGARSTHVIRGSKRSSSQLKSIPIDKIVFDEYDEMEPAMIDLALERLSHSTIKEETYVGTPTLPDYGVDKLYQESDQRVWLIRCKSCNSDTCLEKEFERAKPGEPPEVLLWDGDRCFRACKKCKSEIFPRDGRWVPLFPGRSKSLVGRWISQLNSAFIDPGTIYRMFTSPPNGNFGEVYNSKLGMAYVEAQNRLSIEQVLRLCGNDGMLESSKMPCSMGVDQGRDLHVVIGASNRIVYLGIHKDWEELDGLMSRFSVFRSVVDALPETRNARAFAERHRGKVFLNYYQEHQKGAYRWNEAELTVSCNRTESMDSSHNEVENGKILLPRQSDLVDEFAQHLNNVAKRLEEDELSGSKRYVYVKLGPDHFRHALNYETMAKSIGVSGFFAGCNLS